MDHGFRVASDAAKNVGTFPVKDAASLLLRSFAKVCWRVVNSRCSGRKNSRKFSGNWASRRSVFIFSRMYVLVDMNVTVFCIVLQVLYQDTGTCVSPFLLY